MTRVLVTGVTGFIASALVPMLSEQGYHVRGASRKDCPTIQDNSVVGEIGPATDWSEALADVDVVVHLAARVHIMDEQSKDPLAAFRTVNLEGTRQLAEQAVAAGVKRFIFVSSIKVNGEKTDTIPFRATDEAKPEDPYGLSKAEAESALQKLCHETSMEWVVIRPPLVYGPGVKGNFNKLLRLVAKGIPLPFKGGKNKRSLVSVYNLADLICRCIDSSEAAKQVFLVSDHQDVTIEELLIKMADALDVPSRLFYFPPQLLQLAATLFGKKKEIERLLGTLVVDIDRTRETLNWEPPLELEQGLNRTIEKWNM